MKVINNRFENSYLPEDIENTKKIFSSEIQKVIDTSENILEDLNQLRSDFFFLDFWKVKRSQAQEFYDIIDPIIQDQR